MTDTIHALRDGWRTYCGLSRFFTGRAIRVGWVRQTTCDECRLDGDYQEELRKVNAEIGRGGSMKLHEYIEKAKEELDAMLDKFVEENKLDPDNWPLEMAEEEWLDQEIAERDLS